MARSKPASVTHLIVVGSSAGGIDALSTLMSSLPADLAAPMVIAQHLDPTRQSHLRDILARRSPLPVRTVEDQQPLENGVIYVVPANQHVEITDHMVSMHTEGAGQSKPSIDLLLSSASETFGERLIAVILSGTGSDGASGARAVKKAGGTVVIQNPDTATYPGMPLSLSPTTVDIVANVEGIGPVLRDLLGGIEVPTQPEERRRLESFLEEVRERHGLDFNSYKTPTILRRLQRRVVATKTSNFDGYLRYLNDHPEEYQRLVNAFLIKVTEFFRDPDLFAYLRETVIPDLIVWARKHGNELRIWSAGCATGEEAYSLAMLLAEALGPTLEHFNVRIFATDADADAIAFARRGIYPASALAHVPEELVSRYFVKEDENYQVKKTVRSLTVFGEHDLGGRAPFPRIDLALCRNVLIYFTPELQQRTLKLFAYSVRDGGYLVLGKAESAAQLSELFAIEQRQLKIFRRHGDRVLVPPQGPAGQRPLPVPRPGRGSELDELMHSEHGARRRHSQEESVLINLPVGIIVVDQHYDIQSINAMARRLLGIYTTAIGDDVIHLAQGVSPPKLREAIDAAFRSGATSGIDEFSVEEATAGEEFFVQITCHPQHTDGDKGAIETVMVVLHDVTAAVMERRRLERELSTAASSAVTNRSTAEAEVANKDAIIMRLVETNRQLIEANQELTGVNADLRVTTEEYLVSTEEAQAATEEVETLNEELQATNEELETLNEELQATIEELNTTNDDVHARGGELEDLAATAEDERARLAAILVSMGDAVLVVNPDDSIRLTNAAYAKMFGGAGAPFRAEDEEGRPLPPEEAPQSRAARGESFSMGFAVTAPDGTRRHFEANGQPIRDDHGHGSILVIRDITEHSLHRMQNEFMALASHELRTPLTPLTATLQLLQRQLHDELVDPQARNHVEVALRQTRRLTRLVDDLLDASRLQTGRLSLDTQPTSLNELVSQTVEMAQSLANGQRIVYAEPPETITANVDAGRIQQVLLNLLNNAIIYAPNSERIDVRLRRVDGAAEMQVRDYGPGIAASEVPRLFSRFFQVARTDRPARRGLGLGLYITRQVVDAHGGTIAAQSTEGEGTAFTVHLPIS